MSSNDTLTKKRIAEVFGLSIRSVEKLVESGVIESTGSPMKFEWSAITAYIDYLSSKARGKEMNKSDAENESAKIEAEARLKQAKAEMAELELEELKGNMHRSEDVEEITNTYVFAVRSMFMALPGRLAMDTAKAATGPEAAEVIKKEVYQVLEELSDFAYSKDEYMAKMRERRGWDEEAEESQTSR